MGMTRKQELLYSIYLARSECHAWQPYHTISSDHPGQENANNGKPKQTDKMLHKYADQIVAKVTLVEGADVTDLSPSQIISQINARNKEIKSLQEAGITGAYFDKQKRDQETAIKVLQDELNSRIAPSSATASEPSA